MKALYLSMIAALLLLFPLPTEAATGCTLIVSYPDGKVLKENGDCKQRRSPASTFKIPLALMGFDSGVLKDEHTPSLPYKDKYKASDREKKTTDPTIWEKDSIVWYSQNLTRHLGPDKFQHYVDQFQYGNRDLSGNAGKNDGLTQAWLLSSLKITPEEQVRFLEKVLNRKLGVSDHAYDMTLAILPKFSAGDWQVQGKTGSGTMTVNDGKLNGKQQGWFVGWAQKGNQKIIFARLNLDDAAGGTPAGPKAREEFLSELPAMLP